MRIRALMLSAVFLATFPSLAMSEDQGVFAGMDVFGAAAFGSSNTRNGGGVLPIFQGDGIVENVRFGGMVGVGGHVGYRFNRSWSAIVSYRYYGGDVSWSARYPNFGVASNFEGDATSNVILGSIAYHHALSDVTTVSLRGGLGVAFNRLSNLVETDQATGLFGSNVAGHTKTSPTAEIGLGIQRKITQSATIGLDGAFAYAGGFATGNTRSGNLGVTSINPYEIDKVWRASLGASLRIAF